MKKKKYLKPQVDVAQTGPCMMINPLAGKDLQRALSDSTGTGGRRIYLRRGWLPLGGINCLLPLLSITINEWCRGAPKLKQKRLST